MEGTSVLIEDIIKIEELFAIAVYNKFLIKKELPNVIQCLLLHFLKIFCRIKKLLERNLVT